MAELKAGGVANFSAKPDLSKPLFLVYGPDRGLVSEIVSAIATATGVDQADPFSMIKMSVSDREDQDALMNEAYTVGMFAAARLIIVTDASNDKIFVSQVNRLLADPPPDTFIILRAGELKKGTALRGAVEKAPTGLAIPCYTDSAQTVAVVIEDVLSKANLRLERDARQYLMQNLGGDRAATRAELDKLTLYAHGTSEITLDDVQNIIGDASESDIGAIVDNVLEGDVTGFDRQFQKFQMGNQNINALLFNALRQFQMIDVLRGRMDTEGKNASSVVATARPPVFFARRTTVEQALRIWTGPALRQAIKRLHDAELTSRSARSLDYNA
ncbi:MAG: DNA polymerase III subunit delta, partial [Ahrensia sp.]